MLRKTKTKAALALLLAAGATAAVPVSASAATPACGKYCIGVFSSDLGTYAKPNFVEHVFGGTAAVGTNTGLNAASNTDTSEDFINPHQGLVSDYYKLGLVSADVNSHYGKLKASQLEYAPGGKATGLCVGVSASPYNNEPLSLQSCKVPGRTVWIIGTSLSPATAAHGFFPIISGATTNFANPFAMTYPSHVDTSKALPPIRLSPLQFVGTKKSVPGRQLWGVVLGPLSQ